MPPILDKAPDKAPDKTPDKAIVNSERAQLLHTLGRVTEKAMLALAIVWIGLTIADLLGKLSPGLVLLSNIIWALFGIDFAVKFIIAPQKLAFLRSHWILLISLLLPAFRLLRVLRILGAVRALSLVRILTSLNISIGTLAEAMGRRGVGYVSIITVLVLFGGAAGMYGLENPGQLADQGFGATVAAGGGFHDYGDALWWTAMLMTTIGSQYWPVTVAGRALCFLLSLFSLGVFGYITAALASFFVDKDRGGAPRPSRDELLAGLRQDIAALRAELRQRPASGA
jgi:voltage-gated potassium channel